MMDRRKHQDDSARAQAREPLTSAQELAQAEASALQVLRVLPELVDYSPKTGFQMPYELLGKPGAPVGIEHAKEFFVEALRSGHFELPGDTAEMIAVLLERHWTSLDIRGQYTEALIKEFTSAMDCIARLRESPSVPGTSLHYAPSSATRLQLDESYAYHFSDPAAAVSYITRQAENLSRGLRHEGEAPFEIPQNLDAFNAQSIASRIGYALGHRASQRRAEHGPVSGFDPLKHIIPNLNSAAAVIEAFHYLNEYGRDYKFDCTSVETGGRLTEESATRLVNLAWTAASRRPSAEDGGLIDITSSLSYRGLALLAERLPQHIQSDTEGLHFRLLLPDKNGEIFNVHGKELAMITRQAIQRLKEIKYGI